MSKLIKDSDIFVVSERAHNSTQSGQHLYALWAYGDQAVSDLTADDVKEIISCLQHALDVNKEGGGHE